MSSSFYSVLSIRTVNIKIPERTEEVSSWRCWQSRDWKMWTEEQGQKPSSLCKVSSIGFLGNVWCWSTEQTVLQKGGLCCMGSAELGQWSSWVLSSIFGPIPCTSGPGHKARLLKCSDSGYLSMLVGPYLEAAPTTEQEDVKGCDSRKR